MMIGNSKTSYAWTIIPGWSRRDLYTLGFVDWKHVINFSKFSMWNVVINVCQCLLETLKLKFGISIMLKHFQFSLVRVFIDTCRIIFIIFWDFPMFYQIFPSPQVKRWTIITWKHGIYELPHDFPNHLRLFKTEDLRKLGNKRKVSKPHKKIA